MKKKEKKRKTLDNTRPLAVHSRVNEPKVPSNHT